MGMRLNLEEGRFRMWILDEIEWLGIISKEESARWDIVFNGMDDLWEWL